MTDLNIKTKLDALFATWQQERQYSAFVSDGLLYKNNQTEEETEAQWLKSSSRILFLLKDQNQDGGPYNDDARYWLKDMPTDEEKHNKTKADIRELKNTFMGNLAKLFWGIYNRKSPNCATDDEIKALFNSEPFALMECKKTPGVGTLDDKVLKEHLSKDADFLCREIDLLNPHIIVCFGRPQLDFMKGYVNFKKGTLETIENRHADALYRCTYDDKQLTLIYCYHPSKPGFNASEAIDFEALARI